MTTLVVTPSALKGERFELKGAAHRHLVRARRLRQGERLRLVDGDGRARWSRVEAVGRAGAWVRLEEDAPTGEPELEIEILAGAPRLQRAGWLVEKCAEVGVTAVRFLNTERTPRSYGAAALARLERVAVAAVEQCERSRVPQLSGPHPWRELPGLLAGRAGWLLDPQASGAPLPVLPADRRASLVVGPEGGFSGGERRELASLGCRPFGLGPRSLRVETAAVVGAALLLLATRNPARD